MRSQSISKAKQYEQAYKSGRYDSRKDTKGMHISDIFTPT